MLMYDIYRYFSSLYHSEYFTSGCSLAHNVVFNGGPNVLSIVVLLI